MSNRKKAFETPTQNPSTMFLEWKSNDKCFSYYDKTNQSNVLIDLPFKFLVLDEFHTVKGWNDNLVGNMIANEVKFISKENLIVKCYHKNIKGEKQITEIANGLYSNIKENIKTAGCNYTKSIYIMLENGQIANLQIRGASVAKWGDFSQKNKNRLPEEWVCVKTALDEKKGSVKYSTPMFEFDKTLSTSEGLLADNAFDILEAYMTSYFGKTVPIAQSIEITIKPEDDGLDF